MSRSGPAGSQHVRWARLRTMVRYSAVSLIVVPSVQVAILALQLAGLDGWKANFLAVSALTAPAYLLSRRIVWPLSTVSGSRPIAYFWGLSVGGLAVSSLAVYLMARVVDGLLVANVVNLATYGVIFVARFIWLDRMFSESS